MMTAAIIIDIVKFFIIERVMFTCMAYPTGAPESACTSMQPQHNTAPQSGAAPFKLLAPTLYAPGRTITIQIDSNPSVLNQDLKGFLLQARGSSTLRENYIYGHFYSHAANGIKRLSCTTQSPEEELPLPNTLTHQNNSPKSLPLNFTWMTHEDLGDIVFVATVVTSKDTFWTFQESNTVSPVPPCTKKECADGTCIDVWQNCPEDPCPILGHYRCINGSCGAFRCDGVVQCASGEDEQCCQSDLYQCVSDKSCIDIAYVCDQYPDCHDLDDESNCDQNPCSASEFHCGDGNCVPADTVCDGQIDCPFGKDEELCTSSTTESSLSALPIVAAVGVVVPLVAIIIVTLIVIFCVIHYKRKKRSPQPSNDPPAINHLRYPGTASSPNVQTQDRSPGLYATMGESSGFGGYTNQAYATSPSPVGMKSNPKMRPPSYGSGVSNAGFVPELPPSYEQALAGMKKYPYSQSSSPNESRNTFNFSATSSEFPDEEVIQNYANAAQESAINNIQVGHGALGHVPSHLHGAISSQNISEVKKKPPVETVL